MSSPTGPSPSQSSGSSYTGYTQIGGQWYEWTYHDPSLTFPSNTRTVRKEAINAQMTPIISEFLEAHKELKNTSMTCSNIKGVWYQEGSSTQEIALKGYDFTTHGWVQKEKDEIAKFMNLVKDVFEETIPISAQAAEKKGAKPQQDEQKASPSLAISAPLPQRAFRVINRSSSGEVKRLKRLLKESKQVKAKLLGKIGQLQNKLGQSADALSQLQREYHLGNTRIASLEGQITGNLREIARLEQRILESSESFSKEREALGILVGHLRDENQLLKDELRSIKEQNGALNQQLRTQREQFQELERGFAERESRYISQIEALTQSRAQLRANKGQYLREIGRLNQGISILNAELIRFKQGTSNLRRDNSALISRLDHLRGQFEAKVEELEQTRRVLNQSQEENLALKDALTKSRSEIESLEAALRDQRSLQLRRERDLVSEIQGLKDQVATLTLSLEGANLDKEENSRLTQLITQATSSLDAKERELIGLKASHLDLIKAKEELIDTLKAQNRSLETRLGQADTSLSTLQSEVSAIQRIRDQALEEKSAAIERASSLENQNRSLMQEVGALKARLSSQEAVFQSTQQENRDLRVQVPVALKATEEAYKALSELREVNKRLIGRIEILDDENTSLNASHAHLRSTLELTVAENESLKKEQLQVRESLERSLQENSRVSILIEEHVERNESLTLQIQEKEALIASLASGLDQSLLLMDKGARDIQLMQEALDTQSLQLKELKDAKGVLEDEIQAQRKLTQQLNRESSIDKARLLELTQTIDSNRQEIEALQASVQDKDAISRELSSLQKAKGRLEEELSRAKSLLADQSIELQSLQQASVQDKSAISALEESKAKLERSALELNDRLQALNEQLVHAESTRDAALLDLESVKANAESKLRSTIESTAENFQRQLDTIKRLESELQLKQQAQDDLDALRIENERLITALGLNQSEQERLISQSRDIEKRLASTIEEKKALTIAHEQEIEALRAANAVKIGTLESTIQRLSFQETSLTDRVRALETDLSALTFAKKRSEDELTATLALYRNQNDELKALLVSTSKSLDDLTTENSSLRETLKLNETRLSRLDEDILLKEAQRSDLESRIASSSSSFATQSEENTQLRDSLADLSLEIESLKVQKESQGQELLKARKELAERDIAIEQQASRTSILEAKLIENEALISQLRETAGQKGALEIELNALRELALSQKKDLEENKLALQSTRLELEALSKSSVKDQSTIERLKESEKRLSKAVKSLEENLSTTRGLLELSESAKAKALMELAEIKKLSQSNLEGAIEKFTAQLEAQQTQIQALEKEVLDTKESSRLAGLEHAAYLRKAREENNDLQITLTSLQASFSSLDAEKRTLSLTITQLQSQKEELDVLLRQSQTKGSFNEEAIGALKLSNAKLTQELTQSQALLGDKDKQLSKLTLELAKVSDELKAKATALTTLEAVGKESKKLIGDLEVALETARRAEKVNQESLEVIRSELSTRTQENTSLKESLRALRADLSALEQQEAQNKEQIEKLVRNITLLEEKIKVNDSLLPRLEDSLRASDEKYIQSQASLRLLQEEMESLREDLVQKSASINESAALISRQAQEILQYQERVTLDQEAFKRERGQLLEGYSIQLASFDEKATALAKKLSQTNQSLEKAQSELEATKVKLTATEALAGQSQDLLLGAYSQITAHEDTIREKNREIEALREEIHARPTFQTVQTLNLEIESLQATLKEKDAIIQELSQTLTGFERALSKTTLEKEQSLAAVETLKIELASTKALIEKEKEALQKQESTFTSTLEALEAKLKLEQALIEDKDAKITALKKEIKELKSKLKSNQLLLTTAEGQISRAVFESSKLREVNALELEVVRKEALAAQEAARSKHALEIESNKHSIGLLTRENEKLKAVIEEVARQCIDSSLEVPAAVRENPSAVLDLVKGKIEPLVALNTRLKAQKEDLERRIFNIEKALDPLSQELKASLEELDVQKHSKAQIESELKLARQELQAHEKTIKEVEEIVGQINLVDAPSYTPSLAEQLQGIELDPEILIDRLQIAIKRLESGNSRIIQLEAIIEEKTRENELLSLDRRQVASFFQKEIVSLQSSITTLEKESATQKELIGKLTSELRTSTIELRRKTNLSDEQKQQFEKEIDGLQQENFVLRVDLRDKDNTIKGLEALIKQNTKELAQLKEQIQELETTDYFNKMDKKRYEQTIEKLRADLSTKESLIRSQEDSLEELSTEYSFLEHKLQSSQATRNLLERSLLRLEEQIAPLNQERSLMIDFISEQILDMQSREKTINELKRNILRLTQDEANLSHQLSLLNEHIEEKNLLYSQTTSALSAMRNSLPGDIDAFKPFKETFDELSASHDNELRLLRMHISQLTDTNEALYLGLVEARSDNKLLEDKLDSTVDLLRSIGQKTLELAGRVVDLEAEREQILGALKEQSLELALFSQIRSEDVGDETANSLSPRNIRPLGEDEIEARQMRILELSQSISINRCRNLKENLDQLKELLRTTSFDESRLNESDKHYIDYLKVALKLKPKNTLPPATQSALSSHDAEVKKLSSLLKVSKEDISDESIEVAKVTLRSYLLSLTTPSATIDMSDQVTALKNIRFLSVAVDLINHLSTPILKTEELDQLDKIGSQLSLEAIRMIR